MKRRIFAGILCMVLSLGMIGCSKEVKEKDDKEIHKEERTVLSENQKEALKKEELPLDYEKLNITEQIAIGNIGCMMDYIEEKYGKEFEYVAYYMDDSYMEDPYMEVYAKDDEEQRTVCIETEGYDENKRAIYKDNYLELMSTDEYQQAIEDYIKELIPSAEVCVRSRVDKVGEGDGDILSRADGSTYIGIVNCFSSVEEAKGFADNVITYLNEKNKDTPLSIYVYVQTKEDFDDTYIGSFDDYHRVFRDISYVYHIDADVSGSNYKSVDVEE